MLPLRPARHLIHAYLCAPVSLLLSACLSGCLEPAPMSPPSLIELEGPRGEVSAPGPWLTRVYLPSEWRSQVNALRLAVSFDLLEEGEEGQGGEELPHSASQLIALTPSAREELYLAPLPPLTLNTPLSYQLINASGEPLTPSRSLSLRPSAMSEPQREPPQCALTLLDPREGEPLSRSQDSAQPAGLQYTLIVGYESSPQSTGGGLPSMVKLTTHLGERDEWTSIAEVTRGLAALPRVTLNPGRHLIYAEGFGGDGAHCTLTASVWVDD